MTDPEVISRPRAIRMCDGAYSQLEPAASLAADCGAPRMTRRAPMRCSPRWAGRRHAQELTHAARAGSMEARGAYPHAWSKPTRTTRRRDRRKSMVAPVGREGRPGPAICTGCWAGMAERLGFPTEPLASRRQVDTFAIKGDGAYSSSVRGAPPRAGCPRRECAARVHTSTATFAVLPRPRTSTCSSNPTDLSE